MGQKVMGLNPDGSLTEKLCQLRSKWVPVLSQGRLKIAKECDRLHLPYTVP